MTLIMIFCFITAGCAKREDNTKPVVKTNFLLDTLVKISAYGPEASGAIDDAFGRISDIQEKMTVNEDTSQVISINKASGKEGVIVDDETFAVIERGIFFSELSRGRFDITIGPLVKLWGIGTDRARVPSEEEIETAKILTDYTEVSLDNNLKEVLLNKESMGLDLGAIAKGYAADAAKEVLVGRGVKHAAIDLGGNMMLIGTKPDGTPWKIGVQDPFKPRGNVFATLDIIDKTVVTSGIYERYFESGGKRYHHILDPKTGYPVDNGIASVTIITEKSIDADGLSTSVFALGLEMGMKLADEIPGVSAIFITKDKKVFVSPGVKDYNFTITDDSFKIMNP